MFIDILVLLSGLLLILLGANYLVEGSASIARKSGINEFIIGLAIVGIGTSAPEMIVSFMSSYMGNSDMAIGNIVGSNIFNTMLILGITSVIMPLNITRTNLRRDIPMNIIAAVLLILLGLNHSIFGMGTNNISRIDGAVMVLLFIYYMSTSFRKGVSSVEEEQEAPKLYSTRLSVLMIIGGIAGLVFGGKIFIDSGISIAKACGVSDAFIAITLMAGGTSLPELVTCIIAAAKKHDQLALGNILGSNIFNILLIIGGSAIIKPLRLSGEVTPVDMGAMLLAAIFLLSCSYLFQKKKLDKIEGSILLLMWAAYMTWLIMSV